MKYFKLEEFDSSDEPGSGAKMHEEILHMLDAVRKEYGKPIKINSGYRTEARNKKIGGVPNSSHLKGLAVDISCKKYCVDLIDVDIIRFLVHGHEQI